MSTMSSHGNSDHPVQSRTTLFNSLRSFWHHGAAWIIGPLLVGLCAVFFATQSEHAIRLNHSLTTAFPFVPLLLMPAAYVLIAYVSQRFFPGISGSGIPQAIAALDEAGTAKSSRLLSIRIAVGKIAMALVGLACGASIGREGPTVQIGASIMHAFYGRGPFRNAYQRRHLILAGAAAGIAAAFNTPLAGIMFAIEEMSKKHVFTANTPTLVTVIGSGLISLSLLGNYTYFGTTATLLDWQAAGPAILICGLAGGLAGGIFSRTVIAVQRHRITRLARFIEQRRLSFIAICGLGVALLGLCTHGLVYGTGYEATRNTLEHAVNLPWYFGIAKMLATLLTVFSGIPGGIFAPSLAVGAGIGENVAAIFPSIAPHGAVILLVMAAYLSGVTRAPVMSFIIMMEMTDSHHMLLPLMAASALASGISRLVCSETLYHALAENFTLPTTQQPVLTTPPEKRMEN